MTGRVDAVAGTDWFKDAVIYHVLIDRFAGLKSQDWQRPAFLGGNLAALAEKIPYLQELGVEVLWLSPFCRTSAYHGYHVTDFYEVEPRFGTTCDLKALIEEAHGAGIRVIADFVPNHCSRLHPFFLEAQRDEGSPYAGWFTFRRRPDRYLCFLDAGELPKLNLDHPPARDHIIGAARHWLSLGLDGFRLDHVLGPGHAFWRSFRQEIKRDYPEALLIGEAWLAGIRWRHLRTIKIRRKYWRWLFGISQEEIQREYVGELDGVLDFVVRDHLCGAVSRREDPAGLEGSLKRRSRLYPPGYLLPTFLDNHDTNRFLYECGGDRKLLCAAAELQFSLDQPAVIYYGTEAGMTHERPVSAHVPHSDLQARRPMPWGKRDEGLFTFYQRLIRRKKGRRPAPTP